MNFSDGSNVTSKLGSTGRNERGEENIELEGEIKEQENKEVVGQY